MNLKEALSQIKPTNEQSEKIYGDILDKLSEVPPETKKETNAVMKKRKIVMSVIAAAAAITIAGGSVYAVSPDVREAVKNLFGINRSSVNDYYENAETLYEIGTNKPLPHAEDTEETVNSTNPNADILGDALAVSESDYKEFSEGIYAKLIGVVNCGDYAEVMTEWKFDEPCRYGEYRFKDYSISAFPEYIRGYNGGGGLYLDDHRMISSMRLKFGEKDIPEDMIITFEVKSLDKADSENAHGNIIVEGYFAADFTIGKPLKTCTIDMEPTEISWSHPYMMGAVAKMEMSKINYSPKTVRIDLRMLNDCIVHWNVGRNGSFFYNNAFMFYHLGGDSLHILDYETTPDDYIPLKFKMSDGTLKSANIALVESDFSNDIDKNTLITEEDRLMATYNIPKDKPATVTFSLVDVVDYTNVEAIVFCGKEIPITERDFGLELAPVDTDE